MYWFVLLAWISCLLAFPCHSIQTDYNQLTGSFLSKLKELPFLTVLWLGRWIGLPCSYECHACSHFLAILFNQVLINSWVLFSQSKHREPTLLTELWLGTWIGLSCWHECHACSHSLGILFKQMMINSWIPFRVNLENWRCWLYFCSVHGLVYLVGIHEYCPSSQLLAILFHLMKINSGAQFLAILENLCHWLRCGLVRGLVFLVGMNVTLTQIFMSFSSIRSIWFDWWPQSDLLWCITFEVVAFSFWLLFWRCV
jgi:hypothetical protein